MPKKPEPLPSPYSFSSFFFNFSHCSSAKKEEQEANSQHTSSTSSLESAHAWVTRRRTQPNGVPAKPGKESQRSFPPRKKNKETVQKTTLSTNKKQRYTAITSFRDESIMTSWYPTMAADSNKNTAAAVKWQNPLPQASWSVPIGKYHPGGFAFVRKQSVHTGVDLYCKVGETVSAVEDGTVVAVEFFTGPEAGCPWYNTTMAVLIEGASGVVLYGEIRPNPDLVVGSKIKAGDTVGFVMAVLKIDKGNGTSMLHLELYRKGTRQSVWWEHGKPQPTRLMNPTNRLLEIITTPRQKSS